MSLFFAISTYFILFHAALNFFKSPPFIHSNRQPRAVGKFCSIKKTMDAKKIFNPAAKPSFHKQFG